MNRGEKEQIRGSTKSLNHGIDVDFAVGIDEFSNRIICGDSEDVLKMVPANSIDIIITSPPYNFGLEYKNDTKNDAIHWEEYFRKLKWDMEGMFSRTKTRWSFVSECTTAFF